MARHIDLGKEGEKLAEDWLLSNDFTILYRNWRFKKAEVDIIAFKDDKPHFIEVKIRSSVDFGYPEDSVNNKKIQQLLQAVDAFMYKHPLYTDFRIDILSIHAAIGLEPKFYFIEDVYL